jgi:molecular chaperone GrpE
MSARKQAGEPEVPSRPAGAPEGPTGPAGAPKEQPTGQRGRRDDDNPAAPGRGAEEAAGLDSAEGVGNRAATGREAEEAARVDADLDELLEARKERDEYLELARRTKADFENYRRRAARDTEDAERRGRSGLARDLVPALDNLERALRSAGIDPDAPDSGEDDSSGDGGGLAHGVLLVYRDLRRSLERAGVEAYDPAGEQFDPTWHEALATRSEEGKESGIVLETVEKGYRLDGQVIRAARVIVSE